MASAEYYASQGHTEIPSRGPLAALTAPGAVSGWQQALRISKDWNRRLPLSRLLAEAVQYARQGMPVSNRGAQPGGTTGP